MALVLDDRVKETSTTTGTGTLNLSGAVTAFETFVAGIGDGNTTYYAIVNRDEDEWETGLGTITDSSTDTLARTTVIASSNSDSAVDFSAGTKDVFCTLPASKVASLDTNNNLTIGSGAAGVDYTLTFDGADSDGVITWMEDEDLFKFTDVINVGVDDTGYDVKMFGASAGAYALWDESANLLDLRGATAAGPGHLKLTTGELTVVDADVLGKIEFQAPLESDGSDAVLVGAAIWAEADDTFAAGVNNTDLVFALGKSEAAAEKFRFTADNEIGIAGANYGTDGQVLTSGGAGAACAWEDVTGSITALNNQAESRLVSIGSTTTQLDGEANLTFTGSALTCIGTMTVGVDGTGHDVQFFGATAGAYMLWDENTDDLVLAGAANLYLYDAGGGESLSSDGTDLTINSGSDIHLTATDDVNIPSGVGLTFAATEKIESDGTDLSITVGASGDVNIPADIGLTFGDDGEKIEGDGSDLTISGNTVNLDSSMNHTFSSTGKAMVLGF